MCSRVTCAVQMLAAALKSLLTEKLINFHPPMGHVLEMGLFKSTLTEGCCSSSAI